MDNDNVVVLATPAAVSDPLTDLLRTGARQLIEAAVIAELDEYLAAFDDQNSRTAAGAWFATVTFPSDRSSPGSARLTSGCRKRAAARARRRRSAPRWCRRTYGLL